jgi:hypothetical protein
MTYFPSLYSLSACSGSSARCRAQNWGPAHSHTRQLSGLCSVTACFSFFVRTYGPMAAPVMAACAAIHAAAHGIAPPMITRKS